MMVLRLAFMSVAVALVFVGCAGTGSRDVSVATRSDRNPALARELTGKGTAAWSVDAEEAERLFKAALEADLFHGPARNNLGVIYLGRGELYEAAQEFEFARKLMPGNPDPRLNLGLVLEAAGRADEAMDSYEAALQVYPEHLPTLKALTACELKHNRITESTIERLGMIALRANDELWSTWANRELRKRGE